MKVVLGAYLLSGTPGYRQAGIHQYIRALLETFGSMSPIGSDTEAEAPRFTALISPTARSVLPIPQPLPPNPYPPAPITYRAASRSTESPLGRIRVEQLETPGLLSELGADLYHGMAFVAPLRAPCPTVITVHDLSFITQPQTHKRFNRTYLTLFTRWSCQRAARVISVSEWTKRDLVQCFGIDPAHVDVIPHGVHLSFKPLPRPVVDEFRRANHIGMQAILFLGSLEPRKNLPALITAFHQVLAQAPGTELIVGGSPGWKYEPIYARIKALGLEGKVRFAGRIEQDQLPLWYNACAVFTYPSIYEGFGLPALEAMACGAAVVTSNATSLPEVVGDAGLMVAPTDVGGLAQSLVRVLTDNALNQTLRAKAVQRAARFTWQRSAELTLDTYQRVTANVRQYG